MKLVVGLRVAGLAVLAVGVALLLGYAVAVARYELLLAAVVAVGAGLAIAKPYWTAVALLVASFSLPWLVPAAGVPSEMRFVEDALSICLCLSMAYYAIAHRGQIAWPTGSVWLGVLALGALLSVFASDSSSVTIALGLRGVWKFVPLFLAPVILAWSPAQLRKLLWIVVGLTALQVPVSILQFVSIAGGRSGDAVGGTLGAGSSGVLTTLIIGVATLLMGIYVYVPRLRLAAGLLIALLCIPPALNETKAFFIAAPLVWIVVVLPKLYRKTAVAVALLLFGAIGVFLVAEAYSARYGGGKSVGDVLQQGIEPQLGSARVEGGGLGRGYAVYYALSMLRENPVAAPFGFGAGVLVTSAATGQEGSLILEYGDTLRKAVFSVKFLLEFGVVSVIALAGVMVSIYRSGRRLERLGGDEGLWRALGLGTQGIVITMALMSFYTSTFTTPSLAAVFWLLSGLTVAVLRLLPSRAEDPRAGKATLRA